MHCTPSSSAPSPLPLLVEWYIVQVGTDTDGVTVHSAANWVQTDTHHTTHSLLTLTQTPWREAFLSLFLFYLIFILSFDSSLTPPPVASNASQPWKTFDSRPTHGKNTMLTVFTE